MYLCIYVSMYLCIYVSMYLCIYVSMYMFIYIYIYIHIYIHIHTYIYIYTYMEVFINGGTPKSSSYCTADAAEFRPGAPSGKMVYIILAGASGPSEVGKNSFPISMCTIYI